MLNDLTAAKIDHGLARLALDQLQGLAPTGRVSVREIASRAGVADATILKIEHMAVAKIAARLLADPEIPPHLARRIARALSAKQTSKNPTP